METAELHARVPAYLTERIDKFAVAEKLNRSQAIRELISRGFAFGRPILDDREAQKRIAAAIAEGIEAMSGDFDFEGDAETIPLRGLNKRQLAAAFDVSLKTVNRWCLEGLPSRSSGSRKGGLRFDLPAAIEWRRTADLAEQGDGDDNSLANAKRRNMLAQAKRREIENAKLEGDVIEMDLVQRVVVDRYARFRQRLQNIDLELFGLDERQRNDLQNAMHHALEDISVMRFAEDLEREEEPSEAEFG